MLEQPIVGIIRGIKEESLFGTLDAVIEAGLKTIEITMNTPDAAKLIKSAVDKYSTELTIGAGTVITQDELMSVLDSGAQFIVSPNTDENIAKQCRDNDIPFFPGALTPSEVCKAWSLGATQVKVFPVSSLGGVSYIKNLRGPFDKIKLLACGGVNPDNLKDYFAAGTDSIAIGSQIFNQEWMENKSYSMIKSQAKMFVNLVDGLK